MTTRVTIRNESTNEKEVIVRLARNTEDGVILEATSLVLGPDDEETVIIWGDISYIIEER